MARIDLNVPFAEKDHAKRLGARWDGDRKVWYVPDGVTPGAFGRWLPALPDINVRASSYLIAQSEAHCWKCRELTQVFGFLLPAGHETLEPDDEDDNRDVWYGHDEPTILSYVTKLAPAVVNQVKAMTRHYRVDFSKTTGSSYWMNHCEACGMKQGDFELFCEPDGAFFPMDEQAASQIVLHTFSEPFSALHPRLDRRWHRHGDVQVRR